MKSVSDSTTWTVSKLVVSLEEPDPDQTRVEIPKFQRHLVWSKEQKKDLIDSIQRGYPIGSILLYKKPNGSGKGDLFQVVDGLQRTSTLLAYTKAPLQYASLEALDAGVLDGLADAVGLDVSHVKRSILDWMEDTGKLSYSAPASLKNWLKTTLDCEIPSEESLDASVGSVLEQLDAETKITDFHVPVVIYTGPEENLPEIFERVNQQGTKLNKYEIFAATWLSDSETNVASEDIRKAVSDKYNALIDAGFAIDGMAAGAKIQDFNLFEYLFGLGKVVVQKHPYLFRPRESVAATEPIAFSLTSTVRGLPMSKLSSLPKAMPRSVDELIDPATMENAILLATGKVQEWLKPFIGLRLNLATDGVDIAHGELQIASLIARTVAGRWECRDGQNFAEREGWEDDWARLAIAIPQHYLMDILEETWRGPLYSLLFGRVWATSEEGEITGPARHYSQPVARETWDNVLDTWFSKQMAREQKSRSHVRSAERLMLRFAYTGLVTHLEDNQVQFEIEHLYPVSVLKQLIPAESSGWPISCVSNLALFPKALNREKSSQTISAYAAANDLDAATTEMLDKFLLCHIDDVAVGESGLTEKDYRDFLRERWVTMRGLLYKHLKVKP